MVILRKSFALLISAAINRVLRIKGTMKQARRWQLAGGTTFDAAKATADMPYELITLNRIKDVHVEEGTLLRVEVTPTSQSSLSLTDPFTVVVDVHILSQKKVVCIASTSV